MVETASAPLKMDGEGVRKDIKTTFLIANTFNALFVGGLYVSGWTPRVLRLVWRVRGITPVDEITIGIVFTVFTRHWFFISTDKSVYFADLFSMVAGVYPLSLCAGLMVGEGFLVIEPVVVTLAFGALMATLSALGYYAAFTDNKKTLHTYSAIMGLVIALEVAGVAALPFINDYVDVAVIIFCIVHIGITLAAISLAVALAKRLDTQSGPNKGERVTCFLKYLCCGLLAVNMVFFLYL